MKKIEILILEVIFVFEWNLKYKNMEINNEKIDFFRRFANKFENELKYIDNERISYKI